jgi:sialidase-1
MLRIHETSGMRPVGAGHGSGNPDSGSKPEVWHREGARFWLTEPTGESAQDDGGDLRYGGLMKFEKKTMVRRLRVAVRMRPAKLLGPLSCALFLAGVPMAGRAALESFETAEVGPFTRLDSAVGEWTAAEGHVAVHGGNARSGARTLRLHGAGEVAVELKLREPAVAGMAMVFHAERWTARAPFMFRVDAWQDGSWKEIHQGDDSIKVGGYHARVELSLPAAVTRLRFRCTAPAEGGVLMDDFTLPRPGPAEIVKVEAQRPVVPVLVRETFNPLFGLRVVVDGRQGTVPLESLELILEGTDRLQDLQDIQIMRGSSQPSERPKEVVAESRRVEPRMVLSTREKLAAGEHWFWVSARMKSDADPAGKVQAVVARVKAGGRIVEVPAAAGGPQRVGYAVRMPGDDGSVSYRIPGLARSKAGTLVAVYDIRYRHAGDLPADIDVGVSRSTDGGRSWGPMIVAMDTGRDPKFAYDGVGDPAILSDPNTGRLWLAALWSHGNRAWNGSGPGLSPEETGQFLLAWSDDDGLSWSKPLNITRETKDPAWRLFFNGPGAGIVLTDGTLVFPAQYRAADGIPWSTMISSTDGGKTWKVGTGVKSDTTEAQVVQLADGSIMINCRDNRGGARTVAVTTDLGQTWRLHPTDRSALPESVCMASLLAWEHPVHGRFLVFSNPATRSGRHSMTLKISKDEGMTWPEEHHLLYDSRNGYGYSCLAPVDDGHVGVLYEGRDTMYFLRVPLSEWFR